MPTSTVQLRRYDLKPELVEEFVTWFTSRLVPARQAHGFSVEFAFLDRERAEFTWAVSVEGDAEHFTEVEERYLASPDRDAAFAGSSGGWADATVIHLVERIA